MMSSEEPLEGDGYASGDAIISMHKEGGVGDAGSEGERQREPQREWQEN